ncbi:M949_RS01915 family surface polysaccharide biosynthesis protein [Stenotrophomonas riyadhensis]|uniref:M949_RS01915 family surface polysaccharide biosynthesis protein n=1 Tax=Stenotrophomonas riyadhensis TaxID=2859893 RepID=UPI003F9606F5
MARDVMMRVEPAVSPTGSSRFTLLFVLILTAAGCRSHHVPSAFMTTPSLPEAELTELYPGTLLKQLAFKDVDGPGLLLLSRSAQALPAQGDAEPLDQITLRAELFRRTDEASPWVSRWSVEDPVQCEGLDLEAGYFLDQVTATDLDNDGRAELTLASHSVCGGGIDPQQLRIGLRQGEQYYEVRGESLVHVEGDEPFGGERQNDPALASAAAPLRAHIDSVWEAIKRGSSP